MAFNGNGTFVRLYNWVNDANAGIKIKSDRMNNEDNGFATGLSNCICKDGQTTITANLPMAGFIHTGVGNASLANHYAATGQVQNSAFTWLGTTSGTNTVTASASPTLSAYATGQMFGFTLGGTNTGAVTLNLDGLGAKAVQKNQSALVAGDWTSGDTAMVRYNGTNFQLISIARNPVIPAGAFSPSTITTTQTTLASATTTDLGTIASQNVLISGTTTITSFGSSASTASPVYMIEFSGILTLTHNGTSLIIPGAANITTAAGDTAIVEYLGSSNWRVRLYSKAAGTALVSPTIIQPTRQYLTSTGTYTTPANCKAILVKMIGGGGGGGARATNAGTAGGTTTFNSINAAGGSGGAVGGTSGVYNGGTGGSGSAALRIAGGAGDQGYYSGGRGGQSVFGGAGAGIGATTTGLDAVQNTGAGGAGASTGGNANTGGQGGGGGEYAELYITTPSATYSYTIGAAGVGGAAGTQAGGNGSKGFIVVDEFY